MNEVSSSATRGNRKHRVGIVVSDVQNKTITVEIERRAAHSKYKKVVNVRTRYAVHDENNDAKVGDTVKIGETRPLSKNKRWRLEQIISHAE